MIEIISNDKAYLDWLIANPNGFVINSRKNFDGYHVVHKSTCGTISKPKKAEPGEFTERGYIKSCTNNLKEVDLWLDKKNYSTENPISYCNKCLPEMN